MKRLTSSTRNPTGAFSIAFGKGFDSLFDGIVTFYVHD